MIVYLRRKAFYWTDEQMLGEDIIPALYNNIAWRNGVPYIRDICLGDARVFYFRAIGNEFEQVSRLVEYATANAIRVVDEYLTRDGVGRRPKSLLSEKLTVPNPANTCIDDIEEAKQHNPPFVLKFDVGGRKGLGTFFIRDDGDIDRVIALLSDRKRRGEKGHANVGKWPMIIQEFVPNRGDYRAFVVGYETVSMTKRRARPETLSITGQKTKKFVDNKWPSDIARVAEQAAMDMGVEVAGVDLVRGPNGPCVIEVNEAPMWYYCQERTGINIGEKIKEWLRRL